MLARVTYTNIGTEYALPGYAAEASFEIAGNKYSGKIESDAGPRFGSNYRVEAKDTATVAIMKTYYQLTFPHDDFVITM